MTAERVTLEPVGFEALPGWREDRQDRALAAFRRTCETMEKANPAKAMGLLGGTIAEWLPACRALSALPAAVSEGKARAFFERHFRPALVKGGKGANGLFTGYFEPEIEGSLKPGKAYQVPLYSLPKDLVGFATGTPRHPSARDLVRGRIVNGRGHPYFTREQIDRGAIAGSVPALLYLKDKVDAFFLHVQGSGRVKLPDGSVRRVGFAAKSGLPYTSIGAVLGKSGALPHGGISMQTIKDWLYRNPARADDVLWQNQSYIFFRFIDGGDPELGLARRRRYPPHAPAQPRGRPHHPRLRHAPVARHHGAHAQGRPGTFLP